MEGGTGNGIASVVRRPRPRVGGMWMLLALFYGFPLWWALGIASVIWIVAAGILLMSLWWARAVVAPRGFLLWLLFLGWVMVSGLQLAQPPSLIAFVYRLAMYASAGILLLYVCNLPPHPGLQQRVIAAIAYFWGVLVVFGLLALAWPEFSFRSMAESMLPGSLASVPFVQDLVHPALAQQHDFLGYAVARPSAPFTYTNEWGSALALTTPVFLLWLRHHSRGWRRTLGWVALGSSIVPIVFSLNRGLWLSLMVGFAYATLFLALRGRPRSIVVAAVAVVVLLVSLTSTPLGTVANDRLETGHSDNRRLSLYEQSIDGIAASPLIGHGGPRRASSDAADRAPVGTHGQIWLIAFSHGMPAAVLFVGFLLTMWWRTARVRADALGTAAHVMVVIALTQLPFYSLVTGQLALVLIVVGLALRPAAHAHVPPSSPATEPVARRPAGVREHALHAGASATGAR